MPSEPTTSTRLQYAAACLASAADTIIILSENFQSPILLAISATTKSLLELVQTVKQNKSDCALLMEHTSQLLYAISTVYVKSNTGMSELSPGMLAHIGNFTMTLHKIYTFIEAQQDGSKLKRFFRSAEMNTLLKDCNVGLQQAFNVFKVKAMDFFMETKKIEEEAAMAHGQVLEFIKSYSNSEGSLTSKGYSSSFRSSTSFSLLPSEPKIFHGRESELADMLKQLLHGVAPRIAILGPGGIGKTSLARSVLHHPEVSMKYSEHRFFVACDATSTRKELESVIGSHLGLQLGKDTGSQIISYLGQSPPSLLILDNMETIWEPVETRQEVEDFLSCLADIEQLALMITMRGAERPAGTQWTRPFLRPLLPLTSEAARKTFIDIADDAHDSKDIEEILHMTDNLPLAVNLIAHAAYSEGCSAVLHRWEEEKTTAVSDGFDKKSSLDISIALSLSSPRLASVSGARSLLSLLSILPDGLSEQDLLISPLPIDKILDSKATLLRTSLAYAAPTNQLKVLVPVREYIQRYHPPPFEIVQPLFHKYQELLHLCKQNAGTTANTEITPQIRSNLANFQGILSHRLGQDLPAGDHSQTLYFGLDLNWLSRTLGNGAIPFMEQIPSAVPKPTTDHRLEVYFITEYLRSYGAPRTDIANGLIKQAFMHIPHFADAQIQSMFFIQMFSQLQLMGPYAGEFYQSAAEHFRRQLDLNSAMDTMQQGISSAQLSGDSTGESEALSSMALIYYDLAAYTEGLKYAINAQQAAKRCGDLRREASALRVEAVCWMELGNYQMASSQSQIARSLLVMCGVQGGDMDRQIMSILAEVHHLKSEYVQARELHMQILNNHDRTRSLNQDSWISAVMLVNIAEIDISMGVAAQDAQSKIDAARQMLKNTGWKKLLPACEAVQAELHLRDGNTALAHELLTQQLKLCWGKDNQITTFCMEKLADVHHWDSASNWQDTWPLVLLAYAFKTKQKLSLHKALQFLGELMLAAGDSDTASHLLNVSLEGFTYMDVHRSRAECMLRLGDIAWTQENLMGAEKLWKAAHLLFERSSQVKQVASVDEKLAAITKI